MKKTITRPVGSTLANFNLPCKLHRALRVLAGKRGVTMTALIIAALKKDGIK